MSATPPKENKKLSKENLNSLEILHNPDEMYFPVPLLERGKEIAITPKNVNISKEFFKGFFGSLDNAARVGHWSSKYKIFKKLLKKQYDSLYILYDVLSELNNQKSKFFVSQKITVYLIPEWFMDVWQWRVVISDGENIVRIYYDEEIGTFKSVCNFFREKNPLKLSFLIFQRMFFQSFEYFNKDLATKEA